MSRITIALALAFTATVSLSGCVDETSPPAETKPVATVLDDQLQVMDQAKAMEQQLQAGKERTDAALDEQ